MKNLDKEEVKKLLSGYIESQDWQTVDIIVQSLESSYFKDLAQELISLVNRKIL
ncbi:hypothetical protein HW132_14110 [Brasilonema sp. CT11]|nr:hypothetical protein [Brasilonema sp. CT11]